MLIWTPTVETLFTGINYCLFKIYRVFPTVSTKNANNAETNITFNPKTVFRM